MQNIGRDGRLWVCLLDRLDQRVPLNPTDVRIHHTATSLRAHAARTWSDHTEATR